MKIKSVTWFGIVLPFAAGLAGLVNVAVQYYLYGGKFSTITPPWYAFWDLGSGTIGGLIWYLFCYLILFLISCFLENHGFITIVFPNIQDKEN
jgi:hypothetical protein